MYRSFFPSPGLWVGLAALVTADFIAMAVCGFRIVGYAAVPILAVSAGAAALGYVYTAVRPDERLAALGFGGAYLIAYTLLGAILSYVGTSLNLPLLDAQFARADAALGFDWLTALELTDRWTLLGTLLRAAYFMCMPQIIAVFLILSATRQLTRLADFIFLFMTTSLAIVVLSSLLPAAGAFVYHNPPASLRDVVGHDAGLWHLRHFEALRSGAMRAIDPAAIEGLVTFPSFHAALAAITAWAFWRTRYLAYPALVLNAIVTVSAVPVGGHYLIDIVAGLAIAAVAIAVVAWRRGALPFDLWKRAGQMADRPLAALRAIALPFAR
jgi:membrane-associated phospholipid phosphatase